jgi:hypothetical protein
VLWQPDSGGVYSMVFGLLYMQYAELLSKTHTTLIVSALDAVFASTAIAGQHSVQFCLCSIPRSSPFLTEVHSINEPLHNVGVNCGPWMAMHRMHLPYYPPSKNRHSSFVFSKLFRLILDLGACAISSACRPLVKLEWFLGSLIRFLRQTSSQLGCD